MLQLRRPLADAPRPYDGELVPPDARSNLVTRLRYRTFEGTFPWVPDFTAMEAVATGQTAGINLAVRPRDDNFGIEYTGYLHVPADGTYTFYLTTDSHAFVRLHDAALIDADFGYSGGREVTAAIPLKAGDHALRLSYARGTGGTPALSLQWSGPGLTKQPVPADCLFHAPGR